MATSPPLSRVAKSANLAGISWGRRWMMEAVLVSLLSPFLGRLLKGPAAAVEELADRAGDAAWKYAESVWQKLWPKLKDQPAAEEAAQDVAERPDDDDAKAS